MSVPKMILCGLLMSTYNSDQFPDTKTLQDAVYNTSQKKMRSLDLFLSTIESYEESCFVMHIFLQSFWGLPVLTSKKIIRTICPYHCVSP